MLAGFGLPCLKKKRRLVRKVCFHSSGVFSLHFYYNRVCLVVIVFLNVFYFEMY
jgi:hypothetical protein